MVSFQLSLLWSYQRAQANTEISSESIVPIFFPQLPFELTKKVIDSSTYSFLFFFFVLENLLKKKGKVKISAAIKVIKGRNN